MANVSCRTTKSKVDVKVGCHLHSYCETMTIKMTRAMALAVVVGALLYLWCPAWSAPRSLWRLQRSSWPCALWHVPQRGPDLARDSPTDKASTKRKWINAICSSIQCLAHWEETKKRVPHIMFQRRIEKHFLFSMIWSGGQLPLGLLSRCRSLLWGTLLVTIGHANDYVPLKR